jgi:hypothetical protein
MASNPDQKAGKSMRKFAVEALIGGQVATDAMTKLSQEEQSALLDGVEAALSAARAEALEQAAQLAGKYLQPDGEHFASLIRSLASAPAAPEKPRCAQCDAVPSPWACQDCLSAAGTLSPVAQSDEAVKDTRALIKAHDRLFENKRITPEDMDFMRSFQRPVAQTADSVHSAGGPYISSEHKGQPADADMHHCKACGAEHTISPETECPCCHLAHSAEAEKLADKAEQAAETPPRFGRSESVDGRFVWAVYSGHERDGTKFKTPIAWFAEHRDAAEYMRGHAAAHSPPAAAVARLVEAAKYATTHCMGGMTCQWCSRLKTALAALEGETNDALSDLEKQGGSRGE